MLTVGATEFFISPLFVVTLTVEDLGAGFVGTYFGGTFYGFSHIQVPPKPHPPSVLLFAPQFIVLVPLPLSVMDEYSVFHRHIMQSEVIHMQFAPRFSNESSPFWAEVHRIIGHHFVFASSSVISSSPSVMACSN